MQFRLMPIRLMQQHLRGYNAPEASQEIWFGKGKVSQNLSRYNP